jgi:hypothetical protein
MRPAPASMALSTITDAGSATTDAMADNVSRASASLGKPWSAKNVMLGQASVDKQVADSFLNMAFAMLVAIGLVYLIMVVLFRSLLVPVVILCPLPPAVIGAFVALAVTGHALDLSALIGLLMLIDIVVINATVLLDLAVATNAIVLLDLVQYKIEAGADVRTTLIQDEAHAGARVAHRYKHRCLQTCGDARADRG